MSGSPSGAADGEQDEAALLAAWEAAQRRPAWLRPLALAAALDGGPPLQDLPLGVVAARLLALARRWFGEQLDGVVTCPACRERLAVDLPVAALLAAGTAGAGGGDAGVSGEAAGVSGEAAGAGGGDAGVSGEAAGVSGGDGAEAVVVSGDGWRVTARLPTPADLAAAARECDVEAARTRLLAHIVTGADPAEVLDDPRTAAAAEEALDAALELHDPLSVLTVTMTCPACGAAASAGIDVATWWWALADTRVQRLVVEVHRLARAYGWSEREVLAVGPHRRSRYLALVP